MNKYPIRHLPQQVRDAFNEKLLREHLVEYLPHAVTIRGDKVWTYYSPPAAVSTAFLIKVDLTSKDKQSAVRYLGDYEGTYNANEVDRDKTKRNMEKGKAIIKGHIVAKNGANILSDSTEVIFHPSQMVKPVPSIEVSERERRILFCYGTLKEGSLRRQALHRLDVTKLEIEGLVARGLLKKAGSGHMLTILSETNRLPRPSRGEKVTLVDQW